MDELIDELVQVLQQPDYEITDEFGKKLLDNGIIKLVGNNKIEVIPEVYKRIQDKRALIIKAAKEENELAEIFFNSNPLAFFSLNELNEMLDDRNIDKTVNDLEMSLVAKLIETTGNIVK